MYPELIFFNFVAWIQCGDSATDGIVKKYIAPLQTLSYCSKIECNKIPPEGCTIITVSDKCEVHLVLKGLIDPLKEITKMQKKIDFLMNTKLKLNQAMTATDYEIKVPLDVQQINTEKLNQTDTELGRLQTALESLKLIQ